MENKKEYLKKYLNEEPKKKKKKIKVKKPAVVNPRIKIIDDDINVKSLAHDSEEEEVGEEAPQIVAIIDETRKARWKTLGDSTENVPRKRLDSDSDLSPPRPTEIQQNSENLQRKQRFDTDSDQSLPRPNQNRTNYSDDDLSPLRSKRRNSESGSDQSLPRSRLNKKHSEKSRKKQFQRSDSDSDLSLSRNRSSKKHLEKLQRKQSEKSDSDSDLSLSRNRSSKKHLEKSRRKQSEKSDSDHDVSLSRNRSSKKHSEKSRKKRSERSDSDSDLSLSRNQSSKKHLEKLQKKHSERSDSDISRSSQKRHKKKHKKHSRKSSSPEVAHRKGKDSEKGNEKIDNEKLDKKLKNDIKKTSKKELKRTSNIQLEAVQKEVENEESDGKDIAKTNIEDNAEPEFKETPFARYKDDPELEDHLKSQLREGDPMLAYIRKKNLKNQDETTENVQAYKGPPAPPNRFNINPGHRWDGVDRSNGFEKKYFDNIAQRKAFEELAYKWSVEDM